MNITIDTEIFVPSKEHYDNNYKFLSENDKQTLLDNSKDAIRNSKHYFADDEDFATIQDIKLYEENDKLYAKVYLYDINPHNYTASRMKKLIKNASRHYNRSAEIPIGNIEVNFWIKNIEIEDEDYHNEMGINKIYHNITCHPFYTIGYDNRDEEMILRHYDNIEFEDMIKDSLNFYNYHGMYRCNMVKIELYKSNNNELLQTVNLYYDRNNNILITSM